MFRGSSQGVVFQSILLHSKRNTEAYDEFHCLKEYNDFIKYHNERLKQAVQELKSENPSGIIVYADYYNGCQWLFRKALLLGQSSIYFGENTYT